MFDNLSEYMTLNNILGNFGFILTAFAYVMSDILLLRTLAVASGVVAIIFMYLVSGPPLVIGWNVVLLGINSWRIFTLLRERRDVSFTDEERELYQTIFTSFAPVEFMKLMRIGEWKTEEPGVVLAEENQPIDEVLVIYNGEVGIEKDGVEVVRLRDGTWIGEMSYLQGGNATATVRVLRTTRYVGWGKDELTGLMKRNPTMDVAMKSVLSADLINKLSEKTGDSAQKGLEHLRHGTAEDVPAEEAPRGAES